jgi:hypothetical protein
VQFCPTTIKVGPPPGAPAAAGTFQHSRSFKCARCGCSVNCWVRKLNAPKGARVPIAAPPSRKACPTLSNRDPPQHSDFKVSVRLFKARNLARSVLRNALATLRSYCERKATPRKNHRISVSSNWTKIRDWCSLRSGGAVPFGRRSCPAERQELGPQISCRSHH